MYSKKDKVALHLSSSLPAKSTKETFPLPSGLLWEASNKAAQRMVSLRVIL